ncbi:uncharacterized protein LOC134650664 [Cydia amplana]|uniref:uncharacterized protein LOC134650664 n=1 Tax=Cydia amplana TaxID=1869771 RepID=UPI002FE59FB0
MDIARKITILNMISDSKSVLFGKFDNKLTFEMKVNKWKEIAQRLNEMGVYDKDWKYLRDTTWQNWRKRTIEKRDNRNQTGSAGGKKWQFDETDGIIMSIIGKNTPVLEGLTVPESSGTQAAETIQVQDTSQPIPQNSQNNTNSTNVHYKSVIRLKKEKLEAEILLLKEKTELYKREKYKLDLELFKLEKELNITHSSYTAPYHEQNCVQLDIVQLVDIEEENVQLTRSNTT